MRHARRPRFPQGSLFYDKVVPLLLILMGLLTLALILFAVGVVFGLVQF